MAWYGVNFVLGKGLHSYGFGIGGETYVATFVVLDFCLSVLRSGAIAQANVCSLPLPRWGTNRWRFRSRTLAERMTIRRWSAQGAWLGPLAFAISLGGTELLGREDLRVWAVLLLLGAGMLAVLAWARNEWSAGFPQSRDVGASEAHSTWGRKRLGLALLAGAVLVSAWSHVAFLNAPRATVGVAGWLWLAGMCLIAAAAGARSFVDSPPNKDGNDAPSAWTWWELAVVAFIALLAVALRVVELERCAAQHLPGRNHDGSGSRASVP